MKRIKMFMVITALIIYGIFAQSAVFAENGDVIGKIYSTDIMAKIDGLNAPSYNIGGKTAIIIEELANKETSLTYAINFKYDDAKRRLDVTMNSSKGFWGEQYDAIERGRVGKIAGDVYETDIKVYFNGYEIDGMNIGGRTAVAIEDLGILGGINEEFGYSKYRCKAEWNPDERIISLDFIDNKNYFSVFNYGNFLNYKINDNIISAEFDRMIIAHSEITEHNWSDEFEKDVNILKPLYLDNGESLTEVGFMYIEKDWVDDSVTEKLYITNHEKMKELTSDIHDGKTPTVQEAFELLDDNVNYKILDKLETEDFFVLTIDILEDEDNWNDIAYVLVKKTGGYGKIYSGSTYYKDRVVEKVGENIIDIGEGPTADPHGKPVMMYGTLNLNNYFVK